MDRELERRIIYSLQECCDEVPPGIICETESPDFLFRTVRGLLGIEVTQLFRPHNENQLPRQARERYADELVLSARHQYETRGGKPLDVAVAFSSESFPNRSRRDEIAHYLAELLLRTPVPDHLRVQIECDETNFRTFPGEIAFVRAFRYGSNTASCWAVQDGDWGVDCTPGLLLQRVEEKAGRLSTYREQSPEVWLVLAVNVSGLSTMLEIDRSTLCGTVDSPFDKTILFDCSRRQVIDIGLPFRAPT